MLVSGWHGNPPRCCPVSPQASWWVTSEVLFAVSLGSLIFSGDLAPYRPYGIGLAGEYLFRQGEAADRLYFIEVGVVSVFLEMPDGHRVRLQTLGLGTAVGETSLYLNSIATTSALADSPVTAYRLTRTALADMKAQDPELAASFHEFAAGLLSERLAAITRTLEAVLK